MVPALISALPSLLALPGQQIHALREQVDLNRVIPDLLLGYVAEGLDAPSRHRNNYLEAHCLALLEQGRTWREDELEADLFLAAGTAGRTLSRLASRGQVERNRLGRWGLAGGCHSRNVEVVAVEAKLSRWREALAQALVYRDFANRSYVVLDGSQLRSVAIVADEFRRAGVGLILQYDHTVNLVVESRRGRPRSVRRIHAADRLFACERRAAVRLTMLSALGASARD